MKKPTATLAAPRRRSTAALRESPDAQALLEVRAVRRSDLDRVIDLDATVTGLEKRKYWLSVYRRYGSGQHDEQPRREPCAQIHDLAPFIETDIPVP